jgi:hypothetical protein
MHERRSAPAAVFFLIIWLALVIFGRSSLLQDPGTFWHLVLGQRLLADGELTYRDSFTFTHDGQGWLSLQWLGEAAMAAAYRAAGWDGLLLLTVTILAATYAWLAARLMRAGLHWLPTAVLVAVVIAASSHHFHARPHLATIAFVGLTMAMLCEVESGRAAVSRLWLLVPLFVLWTNVHGGVLAGALMLGIVVVGWCIPSLCGQWFAWILARRASEGGVRGPGAPSLARRAGVTGLAVLACSAGALLVNPYGLEMPRAWLKIMTMPLPELIQEHRPLSLLRPEGWMVAFLAAAYVALLVDAWRHRHKGGRESIFAAIGSAIWRRGGGENRPPTPSRGIPLPPVTWLIPAIWLCLAVQRVRHAPLFAIVAALAIAEILPHTRFAEWLAQWELFGKASERTSEEAEKKTTGSLRAFAVRIVPVAAVLLALIPLMGRGPAPYVILSWAAHDPQRWPVELLPQLKTLEGERPGARVFNALDFGGFLSFYTPRLKTFIDDRCELFGTEFLAAYAEAETRQPERIDEWAVKYQFDLAMVRRGTPFDRHLRQSRNWRPIGESAAASLYRRNDGQSLRPPLPAA